MDCPKWPMGAISHTWWCIYIATRMASIWEVVSQETVYPIKYAYSLWFIIFCFNAVEWLSRLTCWIYSFSPVLCWEPIGNIVCIIIQSCWGVIWFQPIRPSICPSHVRCPRCSGYSRTPAFWDTPHCPMITHTRDSHLIPSQNKTKSKLQI